MICIPSNTIITEETAKYTQFTATFDLDLGSISRKRNLRHKYTSISARASGIYITKIKYGTGKNTVKITVITRSAKKGMLSAVL